MTPVIDFLRGGMTLACAPTMLCSFGLYGSQPLPDAGDALNPQGGPIEAPRQVVATTTASPPAPATPAVAPPRPPHFQAGAVEGSLNGSGLAPSFATGAALGVADTDGTITNAVSVGLRGQYTLGGDSPGFAVIVAPEAAFRIDGRLDAEGTISAELAQDLPGSPRFQSVEASLGASYALDSLTTASADIALTLTQDDPDAITDQPSGVMTAPLAFTGGLDAAVTRAVGDNSFAVTATLGRETASDLVLEDGTRVQDRDAHLSRAGTGLRLGRELTPALTGFVAGEALRTDFDFVDSDNWYYTASAGIAGEWRTLSGEASIGTGLRDYDDRTLADVNSVLFAASLAYAPRSDLNFGLRLASAELPGAETESGDAGRQNSLGLSAAYTASPWLGLTADASYLWELENDGAWAYERYTAAVGADIIWLPQATINAGYAFSLTDERGTPPVDEHRVTLGLTLQP